jgi:uncharacterized protein YgiM (DUF1202 family)
MKKLLLTLLIICLSLTFSRASWASGGCEVYIVYDPNDTYVNVRTAPNGQIIRRIPNGAKTGIFAEKNGWYNVAFDSRFDNIEGFIKKELLWPSTSCYAIDDKDTYVNLREQASINSRVIRRVNNGTPVTCLNGIPENLNTWVKVRLEDGTGKVGYMYGTKVGHPSCD